MGLNILCAVHLVRHPVGGHTWHHLQYLLGLSRLGHTVTFFEHWGWPSSCYDAGRGIMTPDPAYGVAYVRQVLGVCGLDVRWCYLAEDGSTHGSITRDELADVCRSCDLYLDLGGVNWIPELEACRRRVLVDTDPVFTQIGAHGLTPFSRYSVRFTYGENVHRPTCSMPTGGVTWLPTRQPVVLPLWPLTPGPPTAPYTTVMTWEAHRDHIHEGRPYGGRPREFEAFVALPRHAGQPLEVALSAPEAVRRRLAQAGWRVVDPAPISRTPWTYQQYLAGSRAEFSVAKHANVSTRSGWFSDRSSGYLALGRPVIVQDTGFTDILPCGNGLLAYRTPDEALAAIRSVGEDYERHCAAARAIAEEFFDARRVLAHLLERAL